MCPAYSPGPSSIAIIRRPLLPRKAHSSPAVVSHRQGGGAPVLTRDGEHVGGRAQGARVRGHLTTRHRHPLTCPICSSSASTPTGWKIGTIPRYKDVRGGEKIQFETRSGLREQTRRSSRRLVNSKGVTFAFTNQLESVSSQRRRSNGGFIPAVDSIRLRWDWDVVGFNDGIWTVTNQAPEIQKLNSKLQRFCTWWELGSVEPTWEFEYCPDIFCSIS